MSVYILSGLHGDLIKFKSLPKLINFQVNIDILYVLGDVLNRDRKE